MLVILSFHVLSGYFGVSLTLVAVPTFIYPGYQRFFSRAAGIFGVDLRPTHLRP